MTLISILIGIFIDRFFESLPDLRRYRYFHDYVAWMRTRLRGDPWDGAIGVLAVLVPPVLLTGLLQALLGDGLASLLGLLFGIAVLVFTLGPRDLPLDVDHYCAVRGDQDETSRRRLAAHFQPGLPEDADGMDCDRAVVRGILVGAHDRWFGILFWFALLGPMGAVLFRAVELLDRETGEDDFAGTVRQLYGVLGWAPARLMVFAYALSGHFENAIQAWRSPVTVGDDIARHSEAVLLAAGEGALSTHLEEELEQDPAGLIRAAMGLVWRALVVWLAVFAVMILAGWAS